MVPHTQSLPAPSPHEGSGDRALPCMWSHERHDCQDDQHDHEEHNQPQLRGGPALLDHIHHLQGSYQKQRQNAASASSDVAQPTSPHNGHVGREHAATHRNTGSTRDAHTTPWEHNALAVCNSQPRAAACLAARNRGRAHCAVTCAGLAAHLFLRRAQPAVCRVDVLIQLIQHAPLRHTHTHACFSMLATQSTQPLTNRPDTALQCCRTALPISHKPTCVVSSSCIVSPTRPSRLTAASMSSRCSSCCLPGPRSTGRQQSRQSE